MVTRRDGSTRPAEISVNYISYKKTERMVAVIRDITERKQAERALIKSRAQAEAAKAQAELCLDLMGHDINNMNQIGIGFLELAMDNPDLDAAQRELLEKAPGNAAEKLPAHPERPQAPAGERRERPGPDRQHRGNAREDEDTI
jgi:PAS domain-containing protein